MMYYETKMSHAEARKLYSPEYDTQKYIAIYGDEHLLIAAENTQRACAHLAQEYLDECNVARDKRDFDIVEIDI